ncbi:MULTISPECIES: type IV secretion system protein [unclassified Variovorax]|uniref:type IV secretion system protein n=1 Tax=unclassified Variovorax TaxID=663243 RepID=UPI0008395AE7|nr:MULTISPECIES: type IV secretion system protein [unclassified Variovorax]PNG46137.1 Type IV secretion system protein VirB6 [Variovorax sp. B2]PNG46204.1 Type IV secretion system protein VirB6 [Variovorax sp. B4]VTV19262.1 Type IV secretion system protein VirB6 [Variovorax sp. WDL1]
MGFFEQFFTWLNGQLATYVSANASRVAAAIEPAAVTLATIYVMMWGYLSLTGRIQEPILEGVKRILVIGIVLGIGLRLWTYNDLAVDTFTRGPDQLAAAVLGSPSTMSVVDQIWIDGNLIAEQLLSKGSILNANFAYYLAGFLVYFLVGLTVVVTAFLIALSKVALALILALGPIFIVLLLFDATKRFFEAWVAQLANYALVTILATLAAALLLSVLRSYTKNAASLGGAITIAEAARVCIASALVFLVMRQVMSIAAGLASGIALSSFNAVSSLLNWAMGGAKRTSYEFSRGVLDGLRREPSSRWDSFRRLAGNRVGAGVASIGQIGTSRRGGTVLPREQVMPTHSRNR